MNIQNKYPVTIFKRENNYGTFYSVGLSKKNMEGNYVNGYMDCKFKKEVVLDNKTKINMKNAWLDFYVKDKKTIPYIFISDFDLVDTKQEQPKEEQFDPYKTFGTSITGEQLDEDMELPF